MRRLLTLLVMLTVLLVPAFAQAEKPISLFLDGVEINSDVPPVLENDRTLVPVRALTEALGFTVNWDDTTQTVTLTRGTQTIQLVINKQEAIVDGKVVPLDVPPTVRNDRTLIPIRFVLEQVGLQVNWDEANQAVRVNQTLPTGAAARAAATALLEKMEKQGSFKTHGNLDMTVGNAALTMKMQMSMETYNKGQEEMLMYAAVNMMGREQKTATAVYKGQVWSLDPATGAWTKSPFAGAELNINDNPANVADFTAEDLAGAKITLTQQPYQGVSMKVVTVELDIVALAKKLGEDPGALSEGTLKAVYWFNANETPHHVDILMVAKSAEADNTTLNMQGTLFYEAWNQPIPFPAEITGASN